MSCEGVINITLNLKNEKSIEIEDIKEILIKPGKDLDIQTIKENFEIMIYDEYKYLFKSSYTSIFINGKDIEYMEIFKCPF